MDLVLDTFGEPLVERVLRENAAGLYLRGASRRQTTKKPGPVRDPGMERAPSKTRAIWR